MKCFAGGVETIAVNEWLVVFTYAELLFKIRYESMVQSQVDVQCWKRYRRSARGNMQGVNGLFTDCRRSGYARNDS